MTQYQSGILQEVPRHSRYLSFEIQLDTSVELMQSVLKELVDMVDGERVVVGIGLSTILSLSKNISGLRTMPVISSLGMDVPSTPSAIWCWLRGDDRGELYHYSRQLEQTLMPAFTLTHVIDGFLFKDSRDLSGYEDGTENPKDEEAVSVAIVRGKGSGMDGSSFVAVQQWLHDFELIQDMSTEEMDDVIGRHISDNNEFEEAPDEAHVKRSAQESFSPEAFILRRSMPWVEGAEGGLNFVAFGHSFDAFEAILNRMLGQEDGIKDGLFKFTRPVNGAYFWCPPMQQGKLDLRLLGI